MAAAARESLLDDHRAVHEVLAELLTALQNKDVNASYQKLDLLWARLAVHIRAEHLHLFPAVTSRLTEAQAVVDKLREDHYFFMRELARAIGILRETQRPIDSSDAQEKLTSIGDVVSAVEKRLSIHNDMEENKVYYWATTILTETEQSELAARLKAELEHRPSRFSVEVWTNKPQTNHD